MVSGEVLQPKALTLPSSTAQEMAGAIFLSGSKIWFYTGSAYEVVTSG